MRGDPEGAGEAAHEVRWRHVEDPPRLGERQRLEPSLIEEIPELRCDLVVRSVGGLLRSVAQMLPELRAHHSQRGLGLERLIRVLQRAVKRSEAPHDRTVIDVRAVDGSAGQAFAQHLGSHVEHSLAVSTAARGTSIVHDVRWKDRHPGAGGPAVPGFEVVTDGALIHDEDRPGVVGVRRIGMIHEPRVEDLVDAGDRRLPGADPLATHVRHATIVQDPPAARVLDGAGMADSIAAGSIANQLVSFVTFAFVGSVSPGPNNTVLWASGMRFGFRRTIPHVLGTALGIGALVVGVAAGIGVLLQAMPVLELVLKLVGSAYLLYVAYLVLGSGPVGRTDVSHPLSLLQAVGFQCVNPKAWIFAVAAVGAFLPPALHRFISVSLVTGILMLVVVGSSSIWAAGGAALGRVVDDERTRRAVSVVLAAMLVASVAILWI